MVTEEQKQFFDTFGFLVLRKVFSLAEMTTIKRESDEIFSQQLSVALPNGRVALQPFFERGLFMSTLVEDDRIYSIGESLLGSDFFLNTTEGNLHSGNTYWHGSGMWDEKIKAVKIAFYPETLTAASGSLRVIPGSHRRGSPDLLEPLRDGSKNSSQYPFGVNQSEIPCAFLELELGDVAVFTEEILHSAFGGHEGRHQHAINFMENPDTESKLQDVLDFYKVSKYSLRPSESYINSHSPRIRRLVAKNLELGFDVIKGA